jgi:uncharacterized protein (TIGR02271 family)
MAENNNTSNKKENEIIRVHQEGIDISKKVVDRRKISLHKSVNTETVSHDIPLLHDNIRIEHITFNKEVAEIPKIREKGNMIIIPVIEEVAVVTKKIMLVKEIHITNEQTEKIEHIETSLRKESVTIDKKETK